MTLPAPTPDTITASMVNAGAQVIEDAVDSGELRTCDAALAIFCAMMSIYYLEYGTDDTRAN